jgi:hypothetical protein
MNSQLLVDQCDELKTKLRAQRDNFTQAASSFSFRPPIGVISPLSVISPVIATAAFTFRPVNTETKAVHIAAPALGPSFGVEPSGT